MHVNLSGVDIMVKDFVTCPECGMVIDSDMSPSCVSDNRVVFFCSEKHKNEYLEREKNGK